MPDQPELFSEFRGGDTGSFGGFTPASSGEDPAYAALPPEIRQAIDVTMGGAIPGRGPADADALGSPTRSFFDVPVDEAGEPAAHVLGGVKPNFQQRFLHAMGERKVRAEVEEARLHVFDLTDPKDNAEYERIMREIYPRMMAEQGKWIWKCGEPQVLIDPAAPRGFRVIRLVEYARTEIKEGHDPGEFAVVGKKRAA